MRLRLKHWCAAWANGPRRVPAHPGQLTRCRGCFSGGVSGADAQGGVDSTAADGRQLAVRGRLSDGPGEAPSRPPNAASRNGTPASGDLPMWGSGWMRNCSRSSMKKSAACRIAIALFWSCATWKNRRARKRPPSSVARKGPSPVAWIALASCWANAWPGVGLCYRLPRWPRPSPLRRPRPLSRPRCSPAPSKRRRTAAAKVLLSGKVVQLADRVIRILRLRRLKAVLGLTVLLMLSALVLWFAVFRADAAHPNPTEPPESDSQTSAPPVEEVEKPDGPRSAS